MGKQPPLKLLAPRRWRNVACGKERLEEVRLFSQTSFCKVVFESNLIDWENGRLSSSSLLAAGETLLAARSDSRRYGCFRRLAFAKQYLKVFWLTVSFKTTYSLDSTSIPVIISYPPNATRSHTLLERGFLMSYRTLKVENKAFSSPIPIMQFCAAVRATYRKQQIPQL